MQQSENKIIATLVGWVLRIGVALAMMLTLTGLLLYLKEHSGSQVDYSVFDARVLLNFDHFSAGLASADSMALMQLGIMVLIATPIIRVIITLLGFWAERDTRYTWIAAVVLAILLASFLFGATH